MCKQYVINVLGFINDTFSKLMKTNYDELEFHHISENKIDIEILEDVEYESDSETEGTTFSTLQF